MTHIMTAVETQLPGIDGNNFHQDQTKEIKKGTKKLSDDTAALRNRLQEMR